MRRIRVAVIDSLSSRRTRLVRLLSQQPNLAITCALDHALRTHHPNPGGIPPDVLLINLDHKAAEMPRFWCLVRLVFPRANIVGLTNGGQWPVLENALAAGLIGLHPTRIGLESLLRAIDHAARGEPDSDALLLDRAKALLARLPPEVEAQAGGQSSSTAARNRAGIHVNAGLTGREHEILALLGQGLTNRQIAGRLYLSEKTIRNRVGTILSKLQVANRTQAALWGLAHGLASGKNGSR